MTTVVYKEQGNGTQSWIVDGNLTYDSPTNTAHNEMLENILAQYNYLSIGELSLWLNDVDYGAEAQAILNWWITTCKLVAAYVEANPNEIDCVKFINNLPILIL